MSKLNRVFLVIEVKISSRGSGPALNIAQFVGNDANEWNGCRFHINEDCDRADVWFVIEDVDDDDTVCHVPDQSVIFLSAETSWPNGFFDTNAANAAFLDQFTWIYTWLDVYRANVTSAIPFLPWMVNANHGPSVSQPHERDVSLLRELPGVPKERELSVICSARSATPGHQQRLRFITALKEHFQDRLDWYGNGIQPIPTKWEGLAPYRYSIAIENHMAINVVTEKLWDPLLAYTLPLYAGAPNVREFLPADSYVELSIADLNGSIEQIESLLSENLHESRIHAISKARAEILGPLNVYSRIAVLAREWAGRGEGRTVRLEPRAGRPQISTRPPMTRRVGEFFNSIGDTLVQRSRGQ